MNLVEIRLDGSPIAKGRHRHRLNTKTGAIYTHPDAKTRRYEDRLAWAGQIAMAGRPLLEGPLCILFLSFVAIPVSKSQKWKAAALRGEIFPTGRPDFDNYAKVLDSLNKIVWIDDSQIVDATVRKRYSDRPRTEISVSTLDGL